MGASIAPTPGASLTTRERILRRWHALVQERQSWLDHYRELSDYIQPRRGRFLVTDRNKGWKRNQRIQDESALFSLRTFSSGMIAGATSPRVPWFRLTVADPDLAENPSVRDWLSRVEQVLRTAFAQSNFYNILSAYYQDLGLFGTAAVLELEDPKDGIRFYPLTAGQYAISLNPRLEVDTLYRDCSMTVRQLVEQFGYGAVSQRTRDLWDRRSLDTWIECVHAIEPRSTFDPRRFEARQMPIGSWYLEAGADDQHILNESGYPESPLLVSRWETAPDDVYGTSPAMHGLGSTKQLMLAQKDKAKAHAKLVDPPMVADSSMKNERVSLFPGEVNYADTSNGRRGFFPAYEIQPRTKELLEDIYDIRNRISRALYEDVFLLLAQSRGDPRKTAREVQELHEEKLLMLGPAMERLEDEFLEPTIDRTYAILDRRGEIPSPPPELGGTRLKVEFISVLAQAQQLIGAPAVERFLTTMIQWSSVKPDVWIKVDSDDLTDSYGRMLGIPPKSIVSNEEAGRIRAEAARQEQMRGMAELAPGVAKATKDLSEAQPTPGSALARLAAAGAPAGAGSPS
jgi:hypothetical protein